MDVRGLAYKGWNESGLFSVRTELRLSVLCRAIDERGLTDTVSLDSKISGAASSWLLER